MSRTNKDKPDFLKDIKRNEEELSRAYRRDKNAVHPMYHSHMDHCLDCGQIGKNRMGICDCDESSIEDLISIYEKSNVA